MTIEFGNISSVALSIMDMVCADADGNPRRGFII